MGSGLHPGAIGIDASPHRLDQAHGGEPVVGVGLGQLAVTHRPCERLELMGVGAAVGVHRVDRAAVTLVEHLDVGGQCQRDAGACRPSAGDEGIPRAGIRVFEHRDRPGEACLEVGTQATVVPPEVGAPRDPLPVGAEPCGDADSDGAGRGRGRAGELRDGRPDGIEQRRVAAHRCVELQDRTEPPALDHPRPERGTPDVHPDGALHEGRTLGDDGQRAVGDGEAGAHPGAPMQAYPSLWSADLLHFGRAIDEVAEVADGFHLDVFDGYNVDDLLFGPDLVAAVRRRTGLPLDVHLKVTDPDHWARRFLDVGADIINVQSGPCPDVEAAVGRTADLRGCRDPCDQRGAAGGGGLRGGHPRLAGVRRRGSLRRDPGPGCARTMRRMITVPLPSSARNAPPRLGNAPASVASCRSLRGAWPTGPHSPPPVRTSC